MDFDIKTIETQWAIDSKIELTDLNRSSSITQELIAKYFRYLNETRRALRLFEAARSKMILLRTDYYTGNLPKRELDNHGWSPNPRIVIKSEVEKFLAADDYIIDINQNIGECNDIIDMIESIIRGLHNRSFIVSNIIEAKKFE